MQIIASVKSKLKDPGETSMFFNYNNMNLDKSGKLSVWPQKKLNSLYKMPFLKGENNFTKNWRHQDYVRIQINIPN